MRRAMTIEGSGGHDAGCRNGSPDRVGPASRVARPTPRATMRGVIIIAAAVLAAGCAQAAQGTSEGAVVSADSLPSETYSTLRVENRAFNDMTIYVIEASGVRSRLGTATGNTTTTLRIPNRVLGGARTLRFQADPIGSNQAPVSQEITVVPGEVVVLTIPPA